VTGGEKLLPVIDLSLCIGCGECIEKCPTGALVMVEGYPVLINPDLCGYCGDCEDLCPYGAISLPYEVVSADDSSSR